MWWSHIFNGCIINSVDGIKKLSLLFIIQPIDGDTNLRTSRTENDEYKLVDVKDYQDWYNNYIEKHIDKYHIPLNNKVNLESKNKSDTIRLRNAVIDKEITINKFNEMIRGRCLIERKHFSLKVIILISKW